MLVNQFKKNKEKIQKFKETGDSRYVYRNESDKACFYYDLVYRGFKDLTKRTTFDKILRDTVFNITENPPK